MKIYDFYVKDRNGKEINLDQYKGKVLLIINSATQCGFTPQYGDLQKLYDNYSNQGFAILDFPCNQFGNQAPGTVDEIQSFCELNFGVTFLFIQVEFNCKCPSLYKFKKTTWIWRIWGEHL